MKITVEYFKSGIPDSNVTIMKSYKNQVLTTQPKREQDKREIIARMDAHFKWLVVIMVIASSSAIIIATLM